LRPLFAAATAQSKAGGRGRGASTRSSVLLL